LIADQRNFRAKYLQNGEEIMSYFIRTNLISSLLDQRLVDPGSTLVRMTPNKAILRVKKKYNKIKVIYT